MPQISLKSLMKDNSPTYPSEMVQPFRDELTSAGIKELLTAEDVDIALNRQDDAVVLVVLNSVCGCSARSARPGVVFSMLNGLVPDSYVTLFAGMEKDAVNHFRTQYLSGLTPSSPNIALFKNGKLLHILQRYQIEGKTADQIAKDLTSQYDNDCRKINSPEEAAFLREYVSTNYPGSI